MTDELAARHAAAIARLYDLDLSVDPGDVELFQALARRTGGPIVELAVGSGRIAVPLAEDGHDVVGVDLDPAMLERARRFARSRGVMPAPGTQPSQAEGRLTLVEADLLTAATNTAIRAAGPYQLAILALNSILILNTPEGQRAALRSIAGLLAPGGLAVVDTWIPVPADLTAFDGRLSLDWLRTDPETGNEVTKQSAAWFDPVARVVTLTTLFDEGRPGDAPVRWTRSDVLRFITVDELISYATDAGLQVEQVAGDHELNPLAPGSDRAVLLARKPPSA